MTDLVNISFADAGIVTLLGYIVAPGHGCRARRIVGGTVICEYSHKRICRDRRHRPGHVHALERGMETDKIGSVTVEVAVTGIAAAFAAVSGRAVHHSVALDRNVVLGAAARHNGRSGDDCNKQDSGVKS